MATVLRSLTLEEEEFRRIVDAIELAQSRVDIGSREWRALEILRGRTLAVIQSFPQVPR